MAFGAFQQGDDNPRKAMSDINVTPMVDVMLVLLVIFIITAPMLTHAIKLDLPNAKASPAPETPQAIRISVDAQGDLYWGKDKISPTELEQRFANVAHNVIHSATLPDVQLRADKASRYGTIAFVMATAQAQGLSKIGFVTEPMPEKSDKKAP